LKYVFLNGCLYLYVYIYLYLIIYYDFESQELAGCGAEDILCTSSKRKRTGKTSPEEDTESLEQKPLSKSARKKQEQIQVRESKRFSVLSQFVTFFLKRQRRIRNRRDLNISNKFLIIPFLKKKGMWMFCISFYANICLVFSQSQLNEMCTSRLGSCSSARKTWVKLTVQRGN
jgi:hypothetical protein